MGQKNKQTNKKQNKNKTKQNKKKQKKNKSKQSLQLVDIQFFTGTIYHNIICGVI